MRLLSFFDLCEVVHELHVCSLTDRPVLYDSDSCSQELRRTDPINQLRWNHPTSILHPQKWILILLNCAKLKFVSYTSNWLEQMYDFPKRTMLHLIKILNPQDLLQNRSLESVPICIVWQCFTHGNTVCLRIYDEWKRSNDVIVCHKLWSILWLIVQDYSLTIEYQVFEYVPSMSISEQFESILLTILSRISILLLWNDGHQCMELILCWVVESSCLPTHNILPHISWHDPPSRRTTKKDTDFPSMVIFQLLLRKFWIQTWFCNCQHYLCLFTIVFMCIPGKHDLGKMLVLPNQLLYWVRSTSDQYFVSFQPIICHPHVQIRIILFHGVRISIPNWKIYPNRTSIGFSQIAFPITVLPKDDRRDFAQEERLGFPHWTMICAICVVVDESKFLDKYLDIPILKFSTISEHLPFSPGYKKILHQLLVQRYQAVLRWYSWLLLLYLWCWWSLFWILHKMQNHLSQYRLGVQLDLCIFGALPPIRHSSYDRCPSVRQNELLRPSSLLHRSPLIYFWLVRSHAGIFSNFSHSWSTATFAAGIFIAWGIEINLCTKL